MTCVAQYTPGEPAAAAATGAAAGTTAPAEKEEEAAGAMLGSSLCPDRIVFFISRKLHFPIKMGCVDTVIDGTPHTPI